MTALNRELAIEALRATGAVLSARGRISTFQCIIAGGTAGLLADILKPERVTGDCDVMWMSDEDGWREIASAAAEVASRLGLPATWLNRDCAMYAWCLPGGWQSRRELVDRFGPLEVFRLARIDLIASKIVSSPRRSQDRQDLRDIRPTEVELRFVADHLDQLESEHLDGQSFDNQRVVLQALRAGMKRGDM